MEPVELTPDELLLAAAKGRLEWKFFEYPEDAKEAGAGAARGMQTMVVRGLATFEDGDVKILEPLSECLDVIGSASTCFLLRAFGATGAPGAALVIVLFPDDGSDPVLVVRSEYNTFFVAQFSQETAHDVAGDLVASWLGGSLRDGAIGHIEKAVSVGQDVSVVTTLVHEGAAGVEGASEIAIDGDWRRVLEMAGWPTAVE